MLPKLHSSKVLAIVMDTFSDVEIFCDILEATRKRNVYVYLLLDHTNLQLFQDMCENVKINKSHLTVSYYILVRAAFACGYATKCHYLKIYVTFLSVLWKETKVDEFIIFIASVLMFVFISSYRECPFVVFKVRLIVPNRAESSLDRWKRSSSLWTAQKCWSARTGRLPSIHTHI